MTVVDSATGTPTASGASITAIHHGDAIADSVIVPNDPAKDADGTTLGSESGSYEVLVRKAGYESWSKSSIVVERAGCRLQTVSVKALLRRI